MSGTHVGNLIIQDIDLAFLVFRKANQDYAIEHETYSYDELYLQFLIEQEIKDDRGEHAICGEQRGDESLVDTSLLSEHEGQHRCALE